MEIETTVAPAGFHLGHSELHHYTSLAGMVGILASRALWATHFQGLNDSSEVTHLRSELTKAVAQALVPRVIQLRQTDKRILGESRTAGGPIQYATHHARTIVDSFYRVAFTGEGVTPMAPPFIVSFCSHANDHAYERENGLLSQWRGYGSDGGCCIVFDTRGLVEILARECGAFYWIGNGIDAVIYATPDVSIASLRPTLIAEFLKTIEHGIRRGIGWVQPSAGVIVQFLETATRFKHQGFQEEREVRIVAIPGSAETSQAAFREDAEFVPMPIKPIRRSDGVNQSRPFIALFESLDVQLPIRRIIIGPSRHQKDNFQRASAVIRGRIDLVQSATPYIG
jgi:hypothetical protein